jgi:putative spermidine/putrescine transport system substrate-binding protein
MSRKLTRRHFLGSAVAVAAGIVGCGKKASPGPFSGRELRVFVYAGGHEKTMREVFVSRFEEETGATVSLYPGWWDGVPKLKAAPPNDPPFDLMVTDATQGYPAAREGLFAKLDLANVPSHQRLAPAAVDNWVFKEGHGITYPDSVMTLAYNKKGAGAAPVRWADLLRPDLAGKIGLYSSFYMSLYTFACVQADLEGRAGTAHELIEKDLDGVLRFARENRERVKLWWPTSTDMILGLASGECAAGNMHSPEYITALREKPDLGAAVPDADRAFVQVFWAVPAGSPNKDLAERAIDAIFSDEMQLGFARRGSATAVPAVAERMAAEDPFWKQLYPHTPEQFRALRYYPYDVYAEHWDHLADAWDRTVLRKG